MTRLYAAYGSNLHPSRLRARVRSATLVGAAVVRDRALRFHKRGRDGSGKCDIVSAAGEVVCVGVYRLHAADVERLHRIEGVGRGYEVGPLEVPGVGPCFTYLAEADHVDASLVCFSWYRDLVVVGCEYLGFPRSYRDRVAATPAIDDPDRARHARHVELLVRARRDVPGAMGGRAVG